ADRRRQRARPDLSRKKQPPDDDGGQRAGGRHPGHHSTPGHGPGRVQSGEPAGGLRGPRSPEEPMNASLVHRRGSEDGIVLPMTLIIMCLITALTVAFLAFTSTEPAIARNQMMNAQARASADSGVERTRTPLPR